MNFENIALLIIAGGKSSRIGQDKRFIKLGDKNFLEIILEKAAKINFAEKFLCLEENLPIISDLAKKYGAKVLIDEFKDCGAMSGIANGLKNIKTDWALAISADMPFFSFETLFNANFTDVQAIIPVVGGKNQMLAAFYHKNLAEIFDSELKNEQHKLFWTIKKVPHRFLELTDENSFFNVNTRADLRLARGRFANYLRKTPIISIVAPCSGTGKTTFIEKLIKIFSAQKISVGVIKSDSHGFNLDVEGKDSYKFQNSGAKSVAVVSPNGYFLVERVENQNFLSLAEKMSVDLILTESRTHEIFPAISLWRGKGEVIKNDKIAAIFTSEPKISNEIYNFEINDVKSAEKICKFLIGI